MTEAEFYHGLACGCEHWDSACENMPQDYLEAVVAQMMPKQKIQPHLDSIQKFTAAEMKREARTHPRPGQPDFDAPLEDWYRERLIRNKLDAATD